MPVAMMDIIAAHQLKEGILCALIQKNITGRGSVVECSLEKAGLSALVNQASNYLMVGVVASRQGSLHPNIAPYGETFACMDEKEIVLAIGNDKQFQTLCRLLEEPSLSHEENFLFNQNRVLHRIELKSRLSNLFVVKTREEWLKLFIAENIPAGAIRSMDEVLQTEIAKSCILTEEFEGIMTKRMASVAFELSELKKGN